MVDDLIAAGFENVTVLDISGAALRCAQDRIGALASTVKWVEAGITQADLLRRKSRNRNRRAVSSRKALLASGAVRSSHFSWETRQHGDPLFDSCIYAEYHTRLG